MKTLKTTPIRISSEFNPSYSKPTGKFTQHAFRLKSFIVSLFILASMHFAEGQVKGVWGDFRKARPQKTGETYLGLVKGSGSPTGISSFVHLNQRLGLHLFYGIDGFKKNTPMRDQTKLFGMGFQPRLNFRNNNLNGAYYVNMSVVGGTSRIRYVEEKYRTTDIIISTPTSINTDFILGVGAFFEVHRKYQIFVERNYELFYKTNALLYHGSGWQNNFGIRFNIR